MNVIEADGEYTEPLLVDSINILAGEIISQPSEWMDPHVSRLQANAIPSS